jgi:DNA-binding beta-propeller fold protein YncE
MRRARTGLSLALACFILASLRAGAHPPSAIAVDDRGRVFFIDAQEGVFRIDDDGAVTRLSPSAMHFMALDPRGSFAQAPDSFGEWFGRVTPKGERPTIVSCSDFPCAIGPDGNLYFAKMHSLTIVRRTPAGEEIVLADADDFGAGPRHRYGVNGMACGPDGAVYLVNLDSLNKTEGTGEHILHAISLDRRVRRIAEGFVRQPVPEGEEHPEVRPQYYRGMAVDERGNIYIAVTGSRYVMKISAEGDGSVILRAHRPWSPTGVAVRDNSVYVLEYDDEKPTQNREWPLRVRMIDDHSRVRTLITVRSK